MRLETLEGRQLLAASPYPTRAELVQLDRDFAAVRADIAQMQRTSHVTHAEIRAFATDLAECLDVKASGHIEIARPVGSRTEATAFGEACESLLAHLSGPIIEASASSRYWTAQEQAIGADLAAIGHPASPARLDRLTADLQAIARSAAVSPGLAQRFRADGDVVYADLESIRGADYQAIALAAGMTPEAAQRLKADALAAANSRSGVDLDPASYGITLPKLRRLARETVAVEPAEIAAQRSHEPLLYLEGHTAGFGPSSRAKHDLELTIQGRTTLQLSRTLFAAL